MTERDAAARLDGICFCYGSSSERSNRIAKGVMEYVKAVKENGLDKQRGYFSCSHLKETFGLDFNDDPETRYHKITTSRF